jgi:hypothetical protein
MEHEGVSVRVFEEGEVADARIDNVAVELHPLRLEVCARRSDVRDADGDPGGANSWPMLAGLKTSRVTWPSRNSMSFSPSVSIGSPSVSP